MYHRQFKRSVCRGFTLVEMLVTLALLSVLASLGGGVYLQARARGRAVRCLANQQQIAQALLAFYMDEGQFPSDAPDSQLAGQLAEYIPWPESRRSVSVPEVWHCPNDRSDALANSYQPYYVQRVEPEGSRYFVLGCPRHKDTGRAYINLRGINSTDQALPGTVNINGQFADAESSTENRTMHTGTMTFQDGSTATVTSSTASYGVTAVASFQNENGTSYTVVRVTGEGDSDFVVTPGSQFEVITPVAIIGVRGTEFLVQTEPDYTRVAVETGRVVVRDRLSGKTYCLGAYKECEIGAKTGLKKLGLKYVNSDEWEACNPNDFKVDFIWEIVDGFGMGSKYVNAGGTKSFHVGDDDATTVRLTYEIPGFGTQTTTVTR